ncbi:hypothetical protein [Natronosalvus rutilus]|uniref:Uncharacterized protein n=1 Tax=Natronosalvus rutilus TaxID=2953753 RepID=A0A9E7NFP1_9EURY|nr:hypothetical protein [Natronosalvus rutilus]UTF56044.1 hypothetical protein NGM29_20875 [Natronosalvus rutilus]
MPRRASPPKSREEAEELHGEGEVQQCTCGDWYSKHSPAGACFACAVGLKPY